MIDEVLTWFDEWMALFPYPVILTDRELRIIRFNRKSEGIFDIKNSHPNYVENYLNPVHFPLLLEFKHLLEKEFYAQIEIKLHKIGESILIGHRFDEGKPYYILSFFPNVYKERFSTLQTKYHAIMDHLGSSILVTDSSYRIIETNKTFCHMTGYDAEDAIGKLPSLLKSGKQDETFYRQMFEKIHQNGMYEGELVDRKKNGELVYVKSTIFPIANEKGDVLNYIGIMEDITELKFLRNKLTTHSFKDPLTGVHNREAFLNVLEIKIDVSTTESPIALLFIDLNKFKQVNDTYGHHYGDVILAKAASRMRNTLRTHDMIGRYGGDEFLILLERVSDETAQSIARKLSDVLSLPYEIDEQVIDFTSASIGIAMAPADAQKMSELIERADAAMYEAKRGMNPTHIYMANAFNREQTLDKSMRSELINAIGNDEFFIRIQPIIDIQTGYSVGGEVLARWLNLKFDHVRPDIFFSMAKKIGMEKKIDAHILNLTIDFLNEYALDENVFINVNFSGEQFNDIHFIDNLNALFQVAPKLKRHLVVEITEHTMISNVEITSEHLFALRDMGVKVAIDDFGTGFSSLAYLKHFSIDFLKIDISFIRQIESSKKDQDIVQTIIALAHAIGAKTIVEGVERETQYLTLKTMNADYMQGFYCHKPLYPNQFIKTLEPLPAE